MDPEDFVDWINSTEGAFDIVKLWATGHLMEAYGWKFDTYSKASLNAAKALLKGDPLVEKVS